MSDPRNVAHAKKVTQEKKHHGTAALADDMPVAQPGKKRAAAPNEKLGSPGGGNNHADPAVGEIPAPKPAGSLEGSLTVLAKLKEMEFYSRANLEQLAALSFTVEDELKQKDLTGPLGEVLSAQNTFQTKLTALLDAYKVECDRLQGQGA
jgi:hypothetical protein